MSCHIAQDLNKGSPKIFPTFERGWTTPRTLLRSYFAHSLLSSIRRRMSHTTPSAYGLEIFQILKVYLIFLGDWAARRTDASPTSCGYKNTHIGWFQSSKFFQVSCEFLVTHCLWVKIALSIIIKYFFLVGRGVWTDHSGVLVRSHVKNIWFGLFF